MSLPTRAQAKRVLTPSGLREAIQANGVPITTLASLSGVHRVSIHEYLSGKIALSNRKLDRVWEALISYKK